jgi:hypothetical protein
MTGILTGVRPNQYSVAINHRRLGNGLQSNLSAAISSFGGAWTVPSLLRHVLENGPVHSAAAVAPPSITSNPHHSYNHVVDVLSTAPLIAPCYLTVAGSLPGQGCLLTRNRRGEEHRWNMNDTNGTSLGSCVVQSNNDHWNDVANTFDSAKAHARARVGTMDDHNAALSQCDRRALAMQRIRSLNASNSVSSQRRGEGDSTTTAVASVATMNTKSNNGMTIEQLERLLNQSPILSELTIYGAIMSSAHNGLLRTLI